MSIRSCLYSGSVMHRRLRPRPHRLRFGVFWMLFDLDDIDSLTNKLRLFSRNGFNLTSFHDRDHGDGSDIPLRQQSERHLRSAGIEPDGGRIELFCMPRILGYGFNPLSIYFCHRADGTLAAILYEVHNTFGERHGYLIPCGDATRGQVEQQCRKGFYVSPFLDMNMTYRFRVGLPAENISVGICGSDPQGPMITAALTAKRVALSDAALLRACARFPLLTLKVIAGIHWHALRLLLKGMRIRPRPPSPAHPVSIVAAHGPPS